MYHIKNDKRSRLSARLIYEGFVTVQKITPYERITISTLTEASGVGRSTFYRLFDGKDDILLYKATHLFKELQERSAAAILKKRKINEKDVFLPFFIFWFEQKTFLKLLIECNRWPLFNISLHTFFEENLSFIQGILSLNETEWLYFMNLRVSLLSAALSTAVRHDYEKLFIDEGYAEWLVDLIMSFSTQFTFTGLNQLQTGISKQPD